jgi:hypothetical protein
MRRRLLAEQPNILELSSENLAALPHPLCPDDQDEDTSGFSQAVRMLQKHDLNSAVPTFPDLPIEGGILIDKRKRPDWAGHIERVALDYFVAGGSCSLCPIRIEFDPYRVTSRLPAITAKAAPSPTDGSSADMCPTSNRRNRRMRSASARGSGKKPALPAFLLAAS